MTPCKCLQLFSCVTPLFWHLNSSFQQSFDKSFFDHSTCLFFPVTDHVSELLFAHGRGTMDRNPVVGKPWTGECHQHWILVNVRQDNPLRVQLKCLSSLAALLRRFATCEMHSGLRFACVRDPDYDGTRRNCTQDKEPANNPQHLLIASSCDSCSKSLQCWLQCRGTWWMVIQSTAVFG